MKIDADSNGSVDWNEFMNYMLLENETLTSMKAEHFEYVKSNVEDPAPNKTNYCHSDMITCILVLTPEAEGKSKFSADDEEEKDEVVEGRKLVKYITSSRDGTIKIWNGNTQKCSLTINVGKYWVNCIQYMTKSRRLVAACADRTLKFYDLILTNVNLPVSEIADFEGLPLCMDYFIKSKQGLETLVIGDDLGICYMYDFSPDWHSCEWRMDDPEHYCCHKDEILKRYRPIEEEEEENDKEIISDSKSQAKSGAKSDTKKANKKIQDDRKIKIDQKKVERQQMIKDKKMNKYREGFKFTSVHIHKGWITKIQYIEDLNSILSSSFDGFLHFHEFENLGYKDRSFSLHQKGVNSFVYSERHRFVASCGEERHIIMWDPFTRRAITYLNGHTTSVHDVTINDDRNHLISLGTDKNVKIWDIRTYKCIQTIFDKICYRPEDRLT
jgi:WD40 repeat protein